MDPVVISDPFGINDRDFSTTIPTKPAEVAKAVEAPPEKLEEKKEPEVVAEKKEEPPKVEEKKTEEIVEEDDIPSLKKEKKKEKKTVEKLKTPVGQEELEEIVNEKDEPATINVDGMSEEEIDKVIEKLSTEGADTESVSKTLKNSPEYQKAKKALLYARDSIESLTEKKTEIETQLATRIEKYKALQADHDSLKSDWEDATPYIDVLKENEGLADAVANLARLQRTKDEKKQGLLKDKAVDAMYAFLKDLTGVDAREAVTAHQKSKQDALGASKEEGGDVTVEKKGTATPFDLAISQAIGGI